MCLFCFCYLRIFVFQCCLCNWPSCSFISTLTINKVIKAHFYYSCYNHFLRPFPGHRHLYYYCWCHYYSTTTTTATTTTTTTTTTNVAAATATTTTTTTTTNNNNNNNLDIAQQTHTERIMEKIITVWKR